MTINEAKTDAIYVFDIDDTLLYSKSKIGVLLPGEKQWKYYDSSEFAEKREKLPKETKYDFKDFILYDSIYVSITNGKPNLKVLKILDHAINSGYKIGILTARGNQDAIFSALKNFLLYRNKNGELIELPKSQFSKQYTYAINDPATKKFLEKYSKNISIDNPSQAKAIVLQGIFKEKYGFKSIYFYDDDQGNIDAVRDLNDSSIQAIKV